MTISDFIRWLYDNDYYIGRYEDGVLEEIPWPETLVNELPEVYPPDSPYVWKWLESNHGVLTNP